MCNNLQNNKNNKPKKRRILGKNNNNMNQNNNNNQNTNQNINTNNYEIDEKSIDEIKKQMRQEINQERIKKGLKPTDDKHWDDIYKQQQYYDNLDQFIINQSYDNNNTPSEQNKYYESDDEAQDKY